MFIPSYTWKIIVVVTNGAGMAVDRINTGTRVIAVNIPNINGIRSAPWTNYLVSVNQLQTNTGYTFFSALPPYTASVLRTKIDGQGYQLIPPQITGSLTNESELVLSWPVDADGFTLQENDSLDPTGWIPCGGAVFTNGMSKSVMVPADGASCYFRLKHL